MSFLWFEHGYDSEASLVNADTTDDETDSLDRDWIDPEIEVALYGQLHHEANPSSSSSQNSLPLKDVKNVFPNVQMPNGHSYCDEKNQHLEKNNESLDAQRNIPICSVSANASCKPASSKNQCPSKKLDLDQNFVSDSKSLEFESSLDGNKKHSELLTGNFVNSAVYDKDGPPAKKCKTVADICKSLEKSNPRIESVIKHTKRRPQSGVRVIVNQMKSEDSDVIVVNSTDNESSNESIIILSDTERDLKFNFCGAPLVAAVSNDLSNNPDLWKVDDNDRYAMFAGRNRYYTGNKRFFCMNCKHKGHLSKHCPEPIRVIHCFLCGEEGHHGNRCTKPICVRCQGVGHPVEFCRLKDKDFLQQCPICNVPGHLREECPDMWRRYRRTTTEGGKIVQSSDEGKNSRVYCYNCAKKGHYGFECPWPRMDSYSFPSYPHVINYCSPQKSFAKQYTTRNGKSEKQYQDLFKKKENSVMLSNEDFQNFITSRSLPFRNKLLATQRRGSRKRRQDERRSKADRNVSVAESNDGRVTLIVNAKRRKRNKPKKKQKQATNETQGNVKELAKTRENKTCNQQGNKNNAKMKRKNSPKWQGETVNVNGRCKKMKAKKKKQTHSGSLDILAFKYLKFVHQTTLNKPWEFPAMPCKSFMQI